MVDEFKYYFIGHDDGSISLVQSESKKKKLLIDNAVLSHFPSVSRSIYQLKSSSDNKMIAVVDNSNNFYLYDYQSLLHDDQLINCGPDAEITNETETIEDEITINDRDIGLNDNESSEILINEEIPEPPKNEEEGQEIEPMEIIQKKDEVIPEVKEASPIKYVDKSKPKTMQEDIQILNKYMDSLEPNPILNFENSSDEDEQAVIELKDSLEVKVNDFVEAISVLDINKEIPLPEDDELTKEDGNAEIININGPIELKNFLG